VTLLTAYCSLLTASSWLLAVVPLVGLLPIFALSTLCCGIAVAVAYPLFQRRATNYMQTKTTWARGEFDTMFMEVPQEKLTRLFLIAPAVGAALGLLLLRTWIGVVAGVAVGALVPKLAIEQQKAMRKRKFEAQLVDALMLLSSSLKAGLSILQAIEVVTEEMPPPISQEFGLVVKENKMGVSLNDSLVRLNKRVPSDDLNLVITAILVARETGGDVTAVFSRLVETIRDRRKIQERVMALTFMAKAQGYIMMILPIAFAAITYQMNPHFFDVFLHDQVGKMLLMAAVGLEIIGAGLIWLFAKVKV